MVGYSWKKSYNNNYYVMVDESEMQIKWVIAHYVEHFFNSKLVLTCEIVFFFYSSFNIFWMEHEHINFHCSFRLFCTKKW